MKMRVQGFRELDRALAELPKAVGKNVLRRVGKAALEPLANSAANKAPEDQGKLAFSIAVSEQRTRRARGGKAKYLGGGQFRSDPKTSVEIAMGPAAGVGSLYYATHVEFGTVDTPAQPYMRPAWDGGKGAALDYIKTNLGAEIDRAAGRLARRQAKAGR